MIKTFLVALSILANAAVYAQTGGVAAQPTDVSPLLIGEKIPALTLIDVSGKQVNLSTLTAAKPTILIFYRGGWCPYCNTHLAELQAIEDKILDAGYQIVAVSPDAQENLKASLDKHQLKYTLLSDNELKLAKEMGIAFQAPEQYSAMLGKASGGGNKNALPVPAVFVINQNGEILFEHINPDYKKRIKGDYLLAVLNNVNQ